MPEHWNVQVPSASTIRGNRYCRAAPVRPPCERRPEAVVLDLVNPQRACWRMRRFDGQARGDEAGGQVTRARWVDEHISSHGKAPGR